MRELPGLLAEIERVAGRKAALAIAMSYGGLVRNFPSPNHLQDAPEKYEANWLVECIGLDLALRVTREIFPYGGRAEIPSAKAALRRQFVQDNARRMSISEMAAVLEITERGVRGIKASLRKEGLIQ